MTSLLIEPLICVHDAPAWDPYLFLLATEREYQSLLRRLGYDDFEVEVRAFIMTRELAKEVKRLQALWEAPWEV